MIIRGSGIKSAYLANGAAEALADCLSVRGNEAGVLFYFVNKGGGVVIRRMYSQAIFFALQKRAGQAASKIYRGMIFCARL